MSTKQEDIVHNMILKGLKDIKEENHQARKDAKEARQKIVNDLEDLNKKLFIGNGTPSLNSIIIKNALVIKAIIFSISVLYIAIVGAIVKNFM